MIKRLKALVNWLESRFPEKVTVTAESYARLACDILHASQEIDTWIEKTAAVEERITALEYKAAHADALKDLVLVVRVLKDDVTALKANLGWQQPAKVNEEMQAMLNGEII